MILAMIFRSRNVVSFISLILMVSNAVALPLLRSVDLLNESRNWNESSALMTGKQTKMSKMSMSMSMIADVQVHFIEQLLDHFDTTPLPSNLSAVLFQRYFYSPRFVSFQSPLSPQYAFLCVGGEGPALDKSVLVDSVHCTGDMLELARRLYEDQGASVHLFALEHRYYGHSYPIFVNTTTGEKVPPTTNDNLQWLSSKQAQYDLRAFVLNRNQQFQHSPHLVL